MTIGLTIPGVETVHPREWWEQDGYRITDMTRLPTPYRPANVDRGVVHYTAARNVPDGDPGENVTTSIIDRLRASQRDYLINRTGGGYTRRSDNRYFPGYHLGYSFLIDYLGGVTELRGWDYLPAATNQHNDHTVALLCFVDWQDKGTELMWESLRAITREARRRSGRTTTFNPQLIDHGGLTIESGKGTPTQCSGDGLRAQLPTHGNIDADYDPQPPEDDDMQILDKPYRSWDSREHGAPLAAGQTVTVPVGLCARADIVIGSIGLGGAGYLYVNGADNTSAVGYSAASPVQRTGIPVVTPDGHITVTAVVSPAHFTIDVYAVV